MEHHGDNPRQSVIAVIPARYSSVRLPGKLLQPIAGIPLIVHTMNRTRNAANVDRVIVATDNERIMEAVLAAGGEARLTSAGHASGSDRVAEVAADLPTDSIIVNVQGDEPLISAAVIDEAVDTMISDRAADIVTTCERFENARDILDPNNVKVVRDSEGYALYFSRSPIPYPRQLSIAYGSLNAAIDSEPELIDLYRKHTGLYVYRRQFLLAFAKRPQSCLEKTEMLEQLRALEFRARIKVVETKERSIGVDTAEDLELVRSLLEV